jgi:acetyl esterase/lipase
MVRRVGSTPGDDPCLQQHSQDPRIDPRLLSALAAFEGDALAAPPPVGRADGAERVVAYVGQIHAGVEAFFAAIPNDLPGDDRDDRRVVHTTETIPGVDGNAITLHVYRPAGAAGPLPCTIYLHAGGMTILEADNKVHRRWSEDLAATWMVVIAVDFRSAHSAAGTIPFPAGLNDCGSALRWVYARRKQLGTTRLVLQGESGGANLALATTLLAKRDRYLDNIDGVYAMVLRARHPATKGRMPAPSGAHFLSSGS